MNFDDVEKEVAAAFPSWELVKIERGGPEHGIATIKKNNCVIKTRKIYLSQESPLNLLSSYIIEDLADAIHKNRLLIFQLSDLREFTDNKNHCIKCNSVLQNVKYLHTYDPNTGDFYEVLKKECGEKHGCGYSWYEKVSQK